MTNVPIITATWCIVARDCIWASLQMSRIVETHTRCCHASYFTDTQDFLNMLIGSLLEDEQNEEPVILHDRGHCSGEGPEMMSGRVIYFVKSRLEACSKPKCMSSPTQFSAQVQGQWIQPAHPKLEKMKAEAGMNKFSCKNRIVIAGQANEHRTARLSW